MSARITTEFRRKYKQFYYAERRRAVKLECVKYKGGKCQHCGYSKCPKALTFHHIIPSDKEFEISSNGVYKSFESLQAELDKCILLCHNCHAELHAKEDEKVRAIKIIEIEKEKKKRINNVSINKLI